MSGYTLFGSDMSYFSGKARAYLRWKGIDYTEVAPTPDVMKNEIIANIGWPVIPVLKTPAGDYVQDTADIIAHFEGPSGANSAMPDSPLQRFVTYLLQLIADEWLTLPAMHYRWNYPGENQDFLTFHFASLVPAKPNATELAEKLMQQMRRSF